MVEQVYNNEVIRHRILAAFQGADDTVPTLHTFTPLYPLKHTVVTKPSRSTELLHSRSALYSDLGPIMPQLLHPETPATHRGSPAPSCLPSQPSQWAEGGSSFSEEDDQPLAKEYVY